MRKRQSAELPRHCPFFPRPLLRAAPFPRRQASVAAGRASEPLLQRLHHGARADRVL